ncbi:MAG TPA: hypothetical protein PKW75_02095 [candidate division Zixibacteria bacterium]|nr:hypothetical protein [candidate division Zixibacteria bacterium]MDD4917856.1 hypothetical protein [candidate division Zixibacteria bacterium]MDM7973532.1 hypothetical protein [candidate division Zixibacteria bacterium]HOD67398.1 hypothetical protein [candidate division Zixibacteria bacterium]HOZ07055.1 hypothetical protein [candidate division Zixibacteria bacterium]
MSKTSFTQADAERIAKVVAAKSVGFETDHYRFKLDNPEERRSLVLEVYPETSLGKQRGMLVVVYAGNSHLQLHNCTGYVVSEDLGEVTFVAETSERLSGLVVERGAACSQYAAINRDLISSDFTQLGVAVMLSGVALSLAEEILEERKKNDR